MSSALPGIQRVRYLVSAYGGMIGVFLVVIGLLVSLGSIAFFSTPETTTIVVEDKITIDSSQDVYVTIENSSSVYDEGEVLKNEPVYVLPEAPNATIQSTIHSSNSADIQSKTFIVYTASHQDNVFWEKKELVNSESVTGAKNINYNSTVNIPQINNQTLAYAKGFGPVASLSTTVETQVNVSSANFTKSVVISSKVQPKSGGYSISPSDKSVSERKTDRMVSVDKERTVGDTNIGNNRFIVFVGGILIILSGGVFYRVQPMMDSTDERLKLEKGRYDEYITYLPSKDDVIIDDYVETLEDLVYFAIGTNQQVIGVKDSEIFYAEKMDGGKIGYDRDELPDNMDSVEINMDELSRRIKGNDAKELESEDEELLDEEDIGEFEGEDVEELDPEEDIELDGEDEYELPDEDEYGLPEDDNNELPEEEVSELNPEYTCEEEGCETPVDSENTYCEDHSDE